MSTDDQARAWASFFHKMGEDAARREIARRIGRLEAAAMMTLGEMIDVRRAKMGQLDFNLDEYRAVANVLELFRGDYPKAVASILELELPSETK